MFWYILINLFILVIFISLFFVIRKSDKKLSNVDDYLIKVTQAVNSIRYGNLATKIEKIEHPNYKKLSESINRMVETLNDREKMIIEYQNELTRQNRFLEAVINSLSDGILVIDENNKILRITPQIVKWFGEDGKNLLGKNLLDYIQQTEHLKCESYNESEIFIINNASSSFEATTMNLNLDDNKKRFIVIIKDVTNRKELDKLREDFVATLTHDLKVPIVAEANILDFLVNGKFGELNEKQREAVANMRDCNQELLELVQILLETYKTNEAGISLNKEEINLSKFINSIVEDMKPIAEKSDLNINFETQNNIVIQADNLQLKRVIKNLIQNAIYHSESNRDVNIKIEPCDGFINIKIIDYGKGISQDDVEKIFNKYYSTAKKFRKIGTGLGLDLAQQIIKSHGGEIFVKSEENVNTEFCIKLPIN